MNSNSKLQSDSNVRLETLESLNFNVSEGLVKVLVKTVINLNLGSLDFVL